METDFDLLESLRYDSEAGFTLLDAHLARLAASAAHFGFVCDTASIAAQLDAASTDLDGVHKVRLLLSRRGEVAIETAPIAVNGARLIVVLAPAPVRASNEFLRHKTSRRQVYEGAFAARGDADDVLLWNEAGEVTEASSSNIVVRRNGELSTPPVSAGLLPGTLRDHLLRRGEIREAPLPVSELPDCSEIFLVNSVRGWRAARFVRIT